MLGGLFYKHNCFKGYSSDYPNGKIRGSEEKSFCGTQMNAPFSTINPDCLSYIMQMIMHVGRGGFFFFKLLS